MKRQSRCSNHLRARKHGFLSQSLQQVRKFFCAHCAVTERDDRLFLSPAGTGLKVDPAACDRPPAAQDEDRVCSIEGVVDFAEPPRSKIDVGRTGERAYVQRLPRDYA